MRHSPVNRRVQRRSGSSPSALDANVGHRVPRCYLPPDFGSLPDYNEKDDNGTRPASAGVMLETSVVVGSKGTTRRRQGVRKDQGPDRDKRSRVRLSTARLMQLNQFGEDNHFDLAAVAFEGACDQLVTRNVRLLHHSAGAASRDTSPTHP